jgi:two-component system, response regulator PdtaR
MPGSQTQSRIEPAVPEELIAVLVVEDEVLLRINIAAELQEEGFEVFEAGNATEAIAVIEKNPNIRLLFTDVDMPGTMDGVRLAAFVRDRWPPIKIIVTSGHRVLDDRHLPSEGVFLPKPYKTESVIAAIRDLVAG